MPRTSLPMKIFLLILLVVVVIPCLFPLLYFVVYQLLDVVPLP